MVRPHDRAERSPQARRDLVLAIPLVDEHERDVGPPGAHFLDVLVRVEVDDAKGDVGMARSDGLDGARNDAHQQRRDRRDPHFAADVAGDGGDLGAGAAPFGQRVAGMAQQLFARRRQPDAVAASLEQRNAELGLELQDLPVDRRRRDIELFRRAPDRSGPGDLIEIMQNDGVHRGGAPDIG